jgi:hypothetical protein
MSQLQPHSEQKKVCLLLSARVDVRGIVFMKRDNPHERFDDYRQALRRWVARDDFDKLIFVENSGYDYIEPSIYDPVLRERAAASVVCLTPRGR